MFSATKALRVAGLIAFITILVLVVIKLWPEPSIDVVGRMLVEATIDGDMDTVFEHSLAEERNQLGITREKLSQLHDEYLATSLSGFELVDITTVWMASGTQCSVTGIVQDREGRETYISFGMYDTPRGAKAYVVGSLLMAAFLAKNKAQFANEPKGDQVWLAVHNGIATDREFLQSLGFHGWMSGGSSAEVWDWERCLSSYRKNMTSRGHKLDSGLFVPND